ncbi:hypothetical protein [Hyalangium sp.]|uniref:hypothetical protein n=1 Tax=Hyalangium sp. TaxID=2028555 RepID=UPI002D71757D|nr:hypothetical protein [Hyalangium sp.]HYH96969.1 hypothetical protein [Hyalangium sp.]
MLAVTELEATVDALRDAMHLRAPPLVAPSLRLVPSVSELPSRPQEARLASRPRPVVDEDDFDSMWEEGVASW